MTNPSEFFPVFLVVGTTVLSLCAAAYTIVSMAFAMRAKIRTRFMLGTAAQYDAELRHLIQLAETQKITAEDIVRAQRVIENKLTSLSDRDRAFVEEGLHQSSAAGTKRYVSEVLAGA